VEKGRTREPWRCGGAVQRWWPQVYKPGGGDAELLRIERSAAGCGEHSVGPPVPLRRLLETLESHL